MELTAVTKRKFTTAAIVALIAALCGFVYPFIIVEAYTSGMPAWHAHFNGNRRGHLEDRGCRQHVAQHLRWSPEGIQVKIRSGQDALNYPIKLNDKIATLSGVDASADTRPTRQSSDVFTELRAKLDTHLSRFKQLVEKDLASFNLLVKSLEIPAVIVKPAESDESKEVKAGGSPRVFDS